MRTIHLLFILILSFSSQTTLFAETWNEPWQKEIIQKADFFVLATVISNVDSIGTEIEIIKHFGNEKLEGRVLINGFSLLRVTSSSGHGFHLEFEEGQTIYFLLTLRDDGNYAIATPTSGFAILNEDKDVYATYRHSYHQALVPQDIYEKSYAEIWRYYKTSSYNKDAILDFITTNIDKTPAGFEADEIATFFTQHVALETAYLLDITIELDKLKPFIESDNFHSKVSALQLLSNTRDEQSKEYLFSFIKKKRNDNFEIVIAIWSLWKIGGEKYRNKLTRMTSRLSKESDGFGGNIMDPRVGTHFPSPKGAVLELKAK